MSQRMTRKHALAVLHRAKAFLSQSQDYMAETNGAFRQEVTVAFSILAQSIHGQPVGAYSTLLCDRCHLHYERHWIEYRHEGQRYTSYMSLCPSCLEEAKRLLTLISVDFEPYQPDEEAPQASTLVIPVEGVS